MVGGPLSRRELRREMCELEETRHQFEDEWLAGAKDLHKGERCFIIATGPSLNDLDLSHLKGEVTFGVNGTYMLDNVDLTYFVYVSNWWHKQHVEGIRSVRCKRRFLPRDYQELLASETPTSWYLRYAPKYNSSYGLRMPVPRGFSYHPANYLHAGGTVVFVCLQLAYYMGFSEVVIIGLDHSYSKNDEKFKKGPGYLQMESGAGTHFTKNYVQSGTKAHIDLQAMELGYSIAHDVFGQDGRQVINASAKTQLDVFPRVKFDSLF